MEGRPTLLWGCLSGHFLPPPARSLSAWSYLFGALPSLGHSGKWVGGGMDARRKCSHAHTHARVPVRPTARRTRTRTLPLAGSRAEQMPPPHLLYTIPPCRCRRHSLRLLQVGSTRFLLAAHHPPTPESVRSSVAGCSLLILCTSPTGLLDFTENPRTSYHRCSCPLLPFVLYLHYHQLLACHCCHQLRAPLTANKAVL